MGLKKVEAKFLMRHFKIFSRISAWILDFASGGAKIHHGIDPKIVLNISSIFERWPIFNFEIELGKRLTRGGAGASKDE